jgi:hypothetical protein
MWATICSWRGYVEIWHFRMVCSSTLFPGRWRIFDFLSTRICPESF